MHKVVDLEMGVDILAANKRIAQQNADLLKEHKILSFDFVGSIGSGKTLIIEAIIDELKKRPGGGPKVACIAGDVAGDDDYLRFKKHKVTAFNLNTDKECHLDAHLVSHALEHLDLDKIDVLFIENVGNLVCPTDFPLGVTKRVLVISVTEGDDMVRKHPVIFRLSDIIVINKVDLAKIMEVDPTGLVKDAKKVRPDAKIFLTDARHGTQIKELMKEMGL
jgi:hydrogenase nickel incorporation protein HypB